MLDLFTRLLSIIFCLSRRSEDFAFLSSSRLYACARLLFMLLNVPLFCFFSLEFLSSQHYSFCGVAPLLEGFNVTTGWRAVWFIYWFTWVKNCVNGLWSDCSLILSNSFAVCSVRWVKSFVRSAYSLWCYVSADLSDSYTWSFFDCKLYLSVWSAHRCS